MNSYKSIGGGEVQHTFWTRFKNHTRTEIMSITVQLVVRRGTVVFRSKPVTIRKFANDSYPHVGSILPFNKTLPETNVTVSRPSKFLTTADVSQLEVTDVQVWDEKGDLHDAGHLFVKMMQTKNKELIGLFQSTPSLLKVKNDLGFNPILMAFAAADLEMIKFLESKGLQVTSKSTRGHTALFIAAILGSPANLEYALKKGCKVNEMLPSSKRTALHKAVAQGNYGSAGWLLAHGANPNLVYVDHMTPLRYAVREGQPRCVDVLVKAGANVNFHAPSGYGLMHDCVSNYLMFPYVAKLGVSVNDSDK
jgi:hypothetical protein